MDSQQLVRVNSKLNNTYDDFPGGGNASPGRAPGQVGLISTLTAQHARQNSDLDVGELFEGEYQYVELDETPTVDDALVIPERGMLLFWTDRANFKVSTDDTLRSELAGVFLNDPLPEVDGDPVDPAGKFVYMQKVGPKSIGRATVKAVNGTGFAADELVVAAGNGTALANSAAVESAFNAFTVGLAEDAEDADDLVITRLGA